MDGVKALADKLLGQREGREWRRGGGRAPGEQLNEQLMLGFGGEHYGRSCAIVAGDILTFVVGSSPFCWPVVLVVDVVVLALVVELDGTQLRAQQLARAALSGENSVRPAKNAPL